MYYAVEIVAPVPGGAHETYLRLFCELDAAEECYADAMRQDGWTALRPVEIAEITFN